MNFEYSKIEWNYFGLLEGIDLSNIDNLKTDLLIKKNIIQKGDFYLGCSKTFNNIFHGFNNIGIESDYFFINPLLNELFNALKLYVTILKVNPVDIIERELKKANAILDVNEKVVFLKQLYKNIYDENCVDSGYFDEFGVSFKDYVYSIIEDNHVLISSYLTQSKETLKTVQKENDSVINNLEVCRYLERIIESNKEFLNVDFLYVIEEWTKNLEIEIYLTRILETIKELEYGINKSKTATITKTTTLNKLFKNPDDYNRIIEKLKSNNIISEDYSVISQGNGYTNNRIVICIGHLLKKNKYLMDINDKNLAIVLTNTFKIEINKGTYSKAQIDFKTYPADPHLDLLHFIK